jgi:hypothetical protein
MHVSDRNDASDTFELLLSSRPCSQNEKKENQKFSANGASL